jgi:hypothetical protein
MFFDPKKNLCFLFITDSNRWQDGAVLANNPTIIAIREAQLLWPDVQIGCLISIGCGNLPTKVVGLPDNKPPIVIEREN